MYFTKLIIFLFFALTAFSLKAETNPFLSPPPVDGRYIMEIEIQGKVFHDILILEGANEPIDPVTFSGAIKGSIEVPGVFKVPLKGRGDCSAWGLAHGLGFCDFKFSIIAEEGGRKFNVYYEMNISKDAYKSMIQGGGTEFTSQAYLDNKVLLGKFKAVKSE